MKADLTPGPLTPSPSDKLLTLLAGGVGVACLLILTGFNWKEAAVWVFPLSVIVSTVFTATRLLAFLKRRRL